MKKKAASFNDILLLVEEIIHMGENPKGKEKKEIPSSSFAALDMLETMVPMLREQLEETIKNGNMELDGVAQKFIDSELTDQKDKEMIRKTIEMENEAKILKTAYSKSVKEKKGRKKSNLKEKKERKKLFKPLGGDKTWIPL